MSFVSAYRRVSAYCGLISSFGPKPWSNFRHWTARQVSICFHHASSALPSGCALRAFHASSIRPTTFSTSPTIGTSTAMFLLIELGSMRSEEHTSELQSLMRISYDFFCLKKKNKYTIHY